MARQFEMVDAGDQSPRQYNNYGPAPYVAGNNNGVINNSVHTIDTKTQAVLAKLAKVAPDLADLLKRALKDGIISPEAVAALQTAVRNINADVADSLTSAAKHINWDVAERLGIAGETIHANVEKITNAADTLDRAKDKLDASVDSALVQVNGLLAEGNLDRLVDVSNAIAYAAERIGSTAPKVVNNWRVIFKAFVIGVAVGVIGVAVTYLLLTKR